MAKQTFTTGQVLTAAQMTSLQQTAMLGGDASVKTASYVLVAADAGTTVAMNAAGSTTITANSGLFSAGDIVTIINLGAGVSTITAGTATITTSGSLALAQNQGGVLRFTSASAAIFFQFATPASGDIEGVTAGTGISGGGTSGTVTITNSMATAIDAKGDLVVGTGADTFSRLAVGTNGYTLVADSAESTGLKWAAPAGGSSFSGCSLGRSAVLSLANETNVLVSFDQEVFDVGGYHDNSTNNSRITIPSGKAGKYAVCGTAVFAANTSGIRSVYLYKNGSSTGNLWQMSPNTSSGDFISLSFSKIVDLAEGDYLELSVNQSSGGSLNLRFESTSNLTNFAAYLIGA